jgi:IS5 family transposase
LEGDKLFHTTNHDNFFFQQHSIINNLNQEHPLIVLRDALNWDQLITDISQYYDRYLGRPSIDLKVLCGLLMLQHMYKLSDQEVVNSWAENIYFQAFTGSKFFKIDPPCDSSTLCNFRKRLGTEGVEYIFKQTVLIHDANVLEDTGIIDSTVQKKYTAYPVDSKLIFNVIYTCIDYFEHFGLEFNHDYLDELRLLRKNINFSKGKYTKELKIEYINRLREIANEFLNILENKLPPEVSKSPEFQQIWANYRKATNQTLGDKDKIYSIFEPEVACIAKGKAHNKYEFGNKVSIIIGLEQKVILSVTSFTGSPYDGDTISESLDMSKRVLNGYSPSTLIGDLGYRGRDNIDNTTIITPQTFKNTTDSSNKEEIRSLMDERSSIEPIIGHLKSDHHLDRNFLHGVVGDSINAILSAAAFNLKKFVRLTNEKLTVARSKVFGKRTYRPRSKTKTVPFAKPKNIPRLFSSSCAL